MENRSKYTIMILLVLAMTMIIGFMSVYGEPVYGNERNYTEVERVYEQGQCGDDVTYTIYRMRREWEEEDPVQGWVPKYDWSWPERAVISGSGPTYDYGQGSNIDKWKEVDTITVENGVTAIGSYFFSDQCHFHTVILPYGLKSIGKGAFCWCGGDLQSVNVPDTVTYIGPYAFHCCSAITSINIPDGLTTIEKQAFGHMTGIRSVEIPDSVITIKKEAFEDCRSLTDIRWGKGLNRIGEHAFAWCGFTELTIPKQVTSIDSYAFDACKELKKVRIEASLKTLPEGIFSRCYKLEQVIIPSSSKIKTIGINAFAESKSLKSVILPKGTQTIKSGAFSNCPKLREIKILSKKYPKLTAYVFDMERKSKVSATNTKKMTINCPNMSKKEKESFRKYLKKKQYYGKVK